VAGIPCSQQTNSRGNYANANGREFSWQQLYLSVEERGWLGYPAASRPTAEGIMPMPMVASLAGSSYIYRWKRGWLGYPAASRPTAEGIMPMPNLVGHGFVIFGSACAQSICIMRASAWRLLAVASVSMWKLFSGNSREFVCFPKHEKNQSRNRE
jgi:hypothetical protein